MGNDIPYEIVGRRAGDPGEVVACPDRLMNEMNWRPQYIPIGEIVETAWHWHQRYPEGYTTKLDTTTAR